jgi:hypothetical protein
MAHIQDFNEDNDQLEVELKLSQKKVKSDAWKKGPRLTKDQLTNAKFGDGEKWKGVKFKEVSLGSEGDAKVSAELKFGKHKGKTYQWVHDNDRYYHAWACENVPNYEHNARANLKK